MSEEERHWSQIVNLWKKVDGVWRPIHEYRMGKVEYSGCDTTIMKKEMTFDWFRGRHKVDQKLCLENLGTSAQQYLKPCDPVKFEFRGTNNRNRYNRNFYHDFTVPSNVKRLIFERFSVDDELKLYLNGTYFFTDKWDNTIDTGSPKKDITHLLKPGTNQLRVLHRNGSKGPGNYYVLFNGLYE